MAVVTIKMIGKNNINLFFILFSLYISIASYVLGISAVIYNQSLILEGQFLFRLTFSGFAKYEAFGAERSEPQSPC